MWAQIRANRRRSLVLLSGMAAALVILGAAGGMAILGPDGWLPGILLALVIWCVQMAIYFTSAESLLLQGAFARELCHEDMPRLFNVVEEMKIAAGLPFQPRIYLIDDPSPNAFAIGRKPEDGAIAVTTGLLHRLNRDELQGVIAHEIGHLKNRDAQFMTLAAVMLGSIVILSEIVVRSLRFGGRSRSRSSSRGGGQGQLPILLIALVFAILGPLMAQLLFFACSRKREYLADASAAQFTRYPEGLASALEKISQAPTPVSFATKTTAPMFIVNPLAAAGTGFSLFATHPPTADRIQILRSMGGASFADYERAFQRAHQTRLLDSPTLQSATPASIRPKSDAGPIETRQEVRDVTYRTNGYIPITCSCGLETSVPEGYRHTELNCVRCGNRLAIPSVNAPPAMDQPLTYTRTRQGWESFRCGCGRAIQLSPAFSAPRVRCTACQRTIEVTGLHR